MGKGISKWELEYRERIDKLDKGVIKAHESSPIEGFEFFDSDEYKPKMCNKSPKDDATKISFKNTVIKPAIVLGKHILKIRKSQRVSFEALEQYIKDLEDNDQIVIKEHSLMNTYPNQVLWDELTRFAWEEYRVHLGFTEVPEQLIYKKKGILFRYALVCIQEMDEKMMSEAPSVNASDEVVGVYKKLGIAVNELAEWLRKNHNIRCQSNHPLGGLTNTSPLAAKAGMGWQGHNGLLITPQYGQRHRITPIFIEAPIFEFTDNLEHTWIEEFCATCHKCERECPVNAILPDKIIAQLDVPGIKSTRTCIDKEKCYPYFSATLGCGKCVAVCPFSKGENRYTQLKKVIDKERNLLK